MKVFAHFLLWRLGLARPWTFYGQKACELLERLARNRKCLAEIGCWQGVNTARIRRGMAADGVLYAVDPYPAGRLGFNAAEIIARHETGKISNGRVEWLKMTDLEAAGRMSEKGLKFDFIFSDSHNSYEGFRRTWEAWSPLAAQGCVYVLANSREAGHVSGEAGSVRFTREKVLTDPRFKEIETCETFTVLKRV